MEDKKHFVIFQFPNKYLWAMIISWITFSLTSGLLSALARTVFIVSAIIWAYEEIVHGVNWFRKLLGVIVIILIILDIFRLISH